MVRVNIVLNRTVVFDSDWCFDNLCVSWWYYTLVIDPIGQLRRDVIGRLSVKPWCYWLWGLVISNWCVSIRLLLLTNVKDKNKPENRQGAVYKIKCCDCQSSYIGETGRNLSRRLTEHKRATRNGDVNNHIAEHHLKTKHQIDWDSATCITYSTDYYQRLTLESWFTNIEQTPLNRSQQLPAPYKRLIDEIKQN